MTKSIEDGAINFVVSVPKAMWNQMRYLMQERNFERRYAIDQACYYGQRMLLSGLDKTITPELAASIFREFSVICNALANWLEENKTRINQLNS